MQMGELRIDVVSDGTFLLDGGAMFGTVPKTIWSRLMEADAQNRVRLAMNSLLIRGPEFTVLADTGMGDKWPEKMRVIYGLEGPPQLLNELRVKGVSPEEITHVVPSHLHLDHAGWNTRRNDEGELVPTFPNARYVFRRTEWEDALSGHALKRHSYVEDDLRPLERARVVDLFDEDGEILPGIRAAGTGGHTDGHQMLVIEGGGKTLVFLADLFPTSAHLKPHYHMGFDLDPVTIADQRLHWLPWLEESGAICVFPHDAKTPVVRIRRGEKGYFSEPVTDTDF